jgi:hypothetical protein
LAATAAECPDSGGQRLTDFDVRFDARHFDVLLDAVAAGGRAGTPRRRGYDAPSNDLAFPVPDEGVLFWPDGVDDLKRAQLLLAHDHEQVAPRAVTRRRAGEPLLAPAASPGREGLAIESREPIEGPVEPGPRGAPGAPLARGSSGTLSAPAARHVVRVECHRDARRASDGPSSDPLAAALREAPLAVRRRAAEAQRGHAAAHHCVDDGGHVPLRKGESVASLESFDAKQRLALADVCAPAGLSDACAPAELSPRPWNLWDAAEALRGGGPRARTRAAARRATPGAGHFRTGRGRDVNYAVHAYTVASRPRTSTGARS